MKNDISLSINFPAEEFSKETFNFVKPRFTSFNE